MQKLNSSKKKGEAEQKQQDVRDRRGTILAFVSDKIKAGDENKKQSTDQQYVLKSGMLRKKDSQSKNKPADTFWFVLRSVAVTYYRSAVVLLLFSSLSFFFFL